MAGRQKRWGRGQRCEPKWRRAATTRRLRYLIELEDDGQEVRPPAELETSDPCAVGDVILTRPVLEQGRLTPMLVWKITARMPAEDPFAARLTVTAGELAPSWQRTFE